MTPTFRLSDKRIICIIIKIWPYLRQMKTELRFLKKNELRNARVTHMICASTNFFRWSLPPLYHLQLFSQNIKTISKGVHGSHLSPNVSFPFNFSSMCKLAYIKPQQNQIRNFRIIFCPYCQYVKQKRYLEENYSPLLRHKTKMKAMDSKTHA